MIKIGFSGIPCTGKTSAARAFAIAARELEGISKIELVSEYARSYISKHKSIEHIWEQYRIINKQSRWENSQPDSVDLIVTDSPLQLAFLYACDAHTPDSKNDMVLSDIFKLILEESTARPYDIVFHLPPFAIPLEADGVRPPLHLQPEWRKESDDFIRSSFKQFKPRNFFIVEEDTIDARVEFCIDKLKGLLHGAGN